MYSREDVELALEGAGARSECPRGERDGGGCGSTVRDQRLRLPRSCTGAPLEVDGTVLPGEGGEGMTTMRGRAYEAAMTENQLLRAVLDDLKGEGCAPVSISNRRKAESGERLRRETGLPSERSLLLRISKSPMSTRGPGSGGPRRRAQGAPSARPSRRAAATATGASTPCQACAARGSEKWVRRVMGREEVVASIAPPPLQLLRRGA